MPIYEIDGIRPVVHPTAFVHPDAVLIGDAVVGPNSYVGPCAVMRGDFGRVVIGSGANLQDTCVMHSFPGIDAIVEDGGQVGHGAVLHGCRVGRNALIGMNAVVMDGAVVGENVIVAAAAFVKSGFEAPSKSLVAGVPAKVLRELSDEEVAWKGEGAREYQELVIRSHQSLKQVEPLPEEEANRRKMPVNQTMPLYLKRRENS